MAGYLGDVITGVGKRQKEKKIVVDFTTYTQYACVNCITFKSIVREHDLKIGDHLCFKRRETTQFYHAILTNITTTRSGIQMHVVCPSREMSKLFEICRRTARYKNITGDNIIAQEILPEINVAEIKLYVIQYGRQTYDRKKISKRALSLVELSYGNRVPLGSLSSQRTRPEARFNRHLPVILSSHVATWCSTGESFNLHSNDTDKCFEYEDQGTQISMILNHEISQDHINQLSKSYRNHLLCDSCYFSELAKKINSTQNPETRHRLVSQNNTHQSIERNIPRGLYCVKFIAEDDHVLITIKRYSSKYKILARVVKTESFHLTLNKTDRCWQHTNIHFKFPYVNIRRRDYEKF